MTFPLKSLAGQRIQAATQALGQERAWVCGHLGPSWPLLEFATIFGFRL